MPTHAFTDLDTAVDELHALFDRWARQGTFEAVLGIDGLAVLELAVHEWVANLVQHAAFPRGVRIEMTVSVEGDAVRCVVTDTSAGFDMAAQVERQRAVLTGPGPSERGRGLLMMIQSTDDLAFRPADGGPQTVSFLVRDPGDDLFEGLFRADDLAYDPAHGDGQPGALARRAPGGAPAEPHP